MTATIEAPSPFRNRIVGTGEEAPDQLLANPKNWRVHPHSQEAALESVLSGVGWVGTVLVNRTTGHVVDGHLRVALALKRGEPTVPVTYVELSDELEAHLVSFLAKGKREGKTDPDDVPEVPDGPYVQPGDLWLLGEHRLVCGDSTDAETVDRLFAGGTADCVWTDPPYGVEYVGKTSEALEIANDGDAAAGLAEQALRQAIVHVAQGGGLYMASPAGPRMVEFLEALARAGWRIHQELVWVKDVFVLGHSDYHYQHEPVLYAHAPGEGRPGRGKHPGTRWFGDHSQSTVLTFDRPKRSAEHPTMKPVDLVAYCLGNSTPERGSVYDPFCGSGSTIIAAETLERRCYAVELEPRYAQVAIERWQAFTGMEAARG